MSIKQTQELKNLQTRRAKLDLKSNSLSKEVSDLKKELSRYLNQISKIDIKIKELSNNKDIIVSEHAILRYLERKYSLNLDDIRAEIVSNTTRKLVYEFGSGKYPIGDSHKVIIKNNVAITVI